MGWFNWFQKEETPSNGEVLKWPVFQHEALTLFDTLVEDIREKAHDVIEIEICDRKIITAEDVLISFQKAALLVANDIRQQMEQSVKMQTRLSKAQSVDDMMDMEYSEMVG